MRNLVDSASEIPGPSIPGRSDSLQALCHQIAERKLVLDGHLRVPARWRGSLRREAAQSRSFGPERSRANAAFDALAGYEAGVAVDQMLLRRIHYAVKDPAAKVELRAGRLPAVGSDIRSGGAVVRRHGVAQPKPPGSAVPGLLERVFHAATVSRLPAPLVASQLHLDLLNVHPFTDGNGRTARLVASAVLIGAGYKSTLLTAVEQHTHEHPSWYMDRWPEATFQAEDILPWLTQALRAMLTHSEGAFVVAKRRDRALHALASLGMGLAAAYQHLLAYDTGHRTPRHMRAELSSCLDPWWSELGHLDPEMTSHLDAQIRTLSAEEAEELSGAERRWHRRWFAAIGTMANRSGMGISYGRSGRR